MSLNSLYLTRGNVADCDVGALSRFRHFLRCGKATNCDVLFNTHYLSLLKLSVSEFALTEFRSSFQKFFALNGKTAYFESQAYKYHFFILESPD